MERRSTKMPQQVVGKGEVSGEEEDYSLGRVVSHPFYTAMNRRLVKLCELQPWWRVVDLGCGIGAVTWLLVEEVCGDGGQVIAIEPLGEALEEASRSLAHLPKVAVRFLKRRGEDLMHCASVRSMDGVLFCNAIHLVPDKSLVLQNIHAVLRPGGVFAFNSAFFEGAQSADRSEE